jgi:capsid protein
LGKGRRGACPGRFETSWILDITYEKTSAAWRLRYFRSPASIFSTDLRSIDGTKEVVRACIQGGIVTLRKWCRDSCPRWLETSRVLNVAN